MWKYFQGLLNGNVRHSLGGVEGKVSGKKLPRAVQGFLEEKRGQPLGKRWLEWPLPAPYLLLSVGEGVGEGGEGPPGPEQFNPSSSGRNEGLWPPALLTCLLRAKVKNHNFIKIKARPSAAWWLKELSGPLPSESPGGDKPDGSYPSRGSTKHLLRAQAGLWVWGSHLCQQGEQTCLAPGASGPSGWETFNQTHKQANYTVKKSSRTRCSSPAAHSGPNTEACCQWPPRGPCWHKGSHAVMGITNASSWSLALPSPGGGIRRRWDTEGTMMLSLAQRLCPPSALSLHLDLRGMLCLLVF